MKKKLTAILAIALALGLVATSCPGQSTTNGGTTGPPEVGKLAPDFQFQGSDEQLVSISDLKGKPILINFWQVRCPPCRSEMPHIQQFYDEQPGDEVVLLVINIGESSSQVTQFMQSEGFSFPVLLDTEGNIAQQYNIMAIPTTFLIDTSGIIQEIKVGPFQSQAEIENSLSRLD